MAAYANKRFCTLVSKIYEKFYWVDIICPIPYKINICWYDLFDLISSLVNENNRYSLIWGHIRRVDNSRLKDAKQIGKKKTLSSILLYWT